MKLSAWQQSYLNRRSNSLRGSPPMESSGEVSSKSPGAIFLLLIHAACCVVSVLLGFRFSRLAFFFLFSSTTNHHAVPFRGGAGEVSGQLHVHSAITSNPIATAVSPPAVNRTIRASGGGGSGSRVVVGRHGIRIRDWPHPNPKEVMKAHRIMERVQREQRALFGVKSPRTVIAVTPTHVRTFQKLHLSSVMHSLMLVPYDVVWIVEETGGVTNETSLIVAKSGLRVIHVGFKHRMPNSWDAWHKLEARMRLHALRIVRKEKLDGIVMFADDSNMHTMELFDEIQRVKWIGAVSVGILVHSADRDEPSFLKCAQEELQMPVLGPVCNATNNLVGWHTFNSERYAGRSAVYIDDRAPVLPKKLEWSGFVLNSRLLWKDLVDKPNWIKDIEALDGVDEYIESPLSLLRDASVIEPLGSCGHQVLLWWLRVEARTDSKFPAQWMIDPPLAITVPSKRTPWLDTPPEHPFTEKHLAGTQEQRAKHSTKHRTSRSRHHRNNKKKKHETKSLYKF